jgi:hypothetical protein
MARYITSTSWLCDFECRLDGRLIFYQENFATFADFIKAVYKQEQISYPRFYKMDNLSKLGFIAAELLLRNKTAGKYLPEETGIVLSNSASSLDTDIGHQETIRDRSAYYPSPSVFVYTLPNIVIGEICIRHKIKGENAFLVSKSFDAGLLFRYVEELFIIGRVKACLCGWTDILVNQFDCLMMLVEEVDELQEVSPGSFKPVPFCVDQINLLKKPNR